MSFSLSFSRVYQFLIALCLVVIFTLLSPTPPALALGGTPTDYRGKWVVLYFYPKDFTSGCTLEAQRFQKDLGDYTSRNAQIIGVSADSVQSHAEFCDSEGLKFPLLADQGGQVSKAYGSWLGFLSLRHSFIIDPEGNLREIFLNVNPAVHSREVLARLDQLQQLG
jgi:thioredoxin-dependent peroxiredoxin